MIFAQIFLFFSVEIVKEWFSIFITSLYLLVVILCKEEFLIERVLGYLELQLLFKMMDKCLDFALLLPTYRVRSLYIKSPPW